MKTISIIGVGNLAACLIHRLIDSKTPVKIQLYDKDIKKNTYSRRKNISFSITIDSKISKSDMILLAVKPNKFASISEELSKYIKPKTIIISLMAGLKINLLSQSIDTKNTIVRVMTNINARYGNANSFYYIPKKHGNKNDKAITNFLEVFGECEKVKNEREIDKLTALSGSGPAYFIFFTEIVKKVFKDFGFNDTKSNRLAVDLFFSTAFTCKESGIDLKKIRNTVVSKNGTTQAALTTMKERKLEDIIMKSIKSAFKKSIEIGKNN